jgi:hypothetical protein
LHARGFSLEPIVHCVGIAKLRRSQCDSKKLRDLMKFMLRAEPPDPRINPRGFLMCVIACGLESLDQHSELEGVSFPPKLLRGRVFTTWLNEQRRLYGDILQVTPIKAPKSHELRMRGLVILERYMRGEAD